VNATLRSAPLIAKCPNSSAGLHAQRPAVGGRRLAHALSRWKPLAAESHAPTSRKRVPAKRSSARWHAKSPLGGNGRLAINPAVLATKFIPVPFWNEDRAAKNVLRPRRLVNAIPTNVLRTASIQSSFHGAHALLHAVVDNKINTESSFRPPCTVARSAAP